MRTQLLVATAILAPLLLVTGALAADEPPPKLKALSSRIEAKAGQGKNTEADLAAELKAFDKMLAKRRSEKTEDVAWISIWILLVSQGQSFCPPLVMIGS